MNPTAIISCPAGTEEEDGASTLELSGQFVYKDQGIALIFIHFSEGWHSPRPGGTSDVSRGLQSTESQPKQSASRRDASGGFAQSPGEAVFRRRSVHLLEASRRDAPHFPDRFRGLKPTANFSCPAGTGEEGGA